MRWMRFIQLRIKLPVLDHVADAEGVLVHWNHWNVDLNRSKMFNTQIQLFDTNWLADELKTEVLVFSLWANKARASFELGLHKFSAQATNRRQNRPIPFSCF